ncbi:hypothetical protein V8J36_05100 [Frigidibacter sp. MR17.14]|uniref:hypothetical protein n=1 Tax=Frigidibacter sp. MR17.14 TaxID=3126509 RepID=UPI003012CA13
MRVLSAKVTHARRLRDFGRVEALVTLLVKADGRPVPFETRVLTSAPVHGPGALRDRLIGSARMLHQRQMQARARLAA